MGALIDSPPPLTTDIEPPIVLLTFSPQVLDDSCNTKVEVPPSLVDIPFGNAKVEDSRPVVDLLLLHL